MKKDADVLIIGAGLAGLSAAHALASKGKKVHVLEAGKVLGGRTSSWEEDGMPVESGLHKFLGIYRRLPRLLKKCGVDPDDILTWVDAMELHNDEGKRALFHASPYHRPLRSIKTVFGNTHYLSTRDKLRMARMGIAALLQYARDPMKLDQIDIASYAKKYDVSDQAVHDVLHALTSGVFFLLAQEYSTYATFSPIVEGLKRGLTFRIGAFNGGMTEVMIRPIAEEIRRLDGVIEADAHVDRLLIENGCVVGVDLKHRRLHAPAVILATDVHAAQGLIRDAFADHSWCADMLSLPTVSSVTVQCELEKPLFDGDHTHFSTTALCCFGEQAHTTFRHVPGRLSAILYPPEPLLKLDDDVIYQRAMEAAEKLGLSPRVTRYRVIRHPQEFYAMRPGTDVLRPSQRTPIPGFALAGDYTRQPWLASMEGAVVSGEAAAAAVMK